MAAHRYWRAVNLEAYDGGALIALSEFWLLAGTTRVDAGATLTSSVSPVSGALANLADNDTTTDTVLARGTVLSWDFGGSPQDVTDVRLGSTTSAVRFLLVVKLQWSDDAVSWTDAYTYAGLLWPGPRALTQSKERGVWKLGDSFGSGYSIDATGKVLTIPSTATGGARGASYVSSGVRQFEVVVSGDTRVLVGIATAQASLNPPGTDATGWSFILSPAQRYSGGVAFAYGSAFAAGDVLGVVRDFPAGTLTFFKNGASMGTAYSGLAATEVAPTAGVNVAAARTITLRTSGFAFPIAGATAWEDTSAALTGPFSRTTALGVVASRGAVPTFPGAVLKDRQRARPDYRFDPAARGRIYGTVAREGLPIDIPLRRRVTLMRQVDDMPIQTQWSDAVTGAFDFQWIETDQAYYVKAHDYEHNFSAVIADNLTLDNGGVELMP